MYTSGNEIHKSDTQGSHFRKRFQRGKVGGGCNPRENRHKNIPRRTRTYPHGLPSVATKILGRTLTDSPVLAQKF